MTYAAAHVVEPTPERHADTAAVRACYEILTVLEGDRNSRREAAFPRAVRERQERRSS